MNLEEIKKQQEALVALKSAQFDLLSQELKLNRELTRSIERRKKQVDVVYTLHDAYDDLIFKEGLLKGQVEDISDNIEKLTKNYDKSISEIRRLRKEQDELRKNNLENSEEYKRLTKSIEEEEKKIKDLAVSTKNYMTKLQEIDKDLNVIRDSSDNLRESFKKLGEMELGEVKDIEDVNTFVERRARLLDSIYETQAMLNLISKEELEYLKEQTKSLDLTLDSQYKYYTLVKKISKEDKEVLENLIKRVKENKKLGSLEKAMEVRRMELTGEKFRAIGGYLTPRGTLKGRLEAAKAIEEIGKELTSLNNIAKASGKGIAFVSTAFKGLGTVIGQLGVLGIFAVVIQGIVEAAKAINEMDKFLKQFNKTFVKLQGPSVLLEDVGGSIKRFTDSVFDLKKQLKYGIKAEEIMDMFKGIGEAGLSLQGIITRVSGGYGRIIEEAAKIHLDYGVALEEAGSMIGEQMMDLRATIDDVVVGFKSLSYDAAKAGVQSQKFYQATYAAAEALSYYGNFVKAASNALRDFQEKGAMGFKDAQKEAQETIELFKNMDKSTAIAFMEMSGGVESYREEFRKLAEDSKRRIDEHNKIIKEKTADLEEAKKRGDKRSIERLRDEIAAQEKMLDTAQRTFAQADLAARSNAQDMAMYLEMLTDKVPERLGVYFESLRKELGPDVFKDTVAIVNHMKVMLGVSEDYAKKMVGTLLTIRENVRTMSGDFKKMIENLPTRERSAARKELLKVMEDSMKEGKLNLRVLKRGVLDVSNRFNLDSESLIRYLEKYPIAATELLKKGYSYIDSQLDDIALKELKTVEKVTGEQEDDHLKRLDDIVKNTVTMEDMLDISKKYAQYIVASSDPIRKTAEMAISTERKVSEAVYFLEKIARGDKPQDLEGSKEYKELVDLFKEEYLLKSKKELTEKEKARLEDIKEVKKKREKEYGHLYYKMSMEAEEKARGVMEERSRVGEEIEELVSKIRSSSVEDEKRYLRERLKHVIGAYRSQYGETPSLRVETVTPERDYKALSSGYAMLSKGDVVVSGKDMAKGISAGYGDFAGMGIVELLKGMKTLERREAPTIPVNINIGTVSGDPEEFLKKIKPAIEQTFERMYFEKQKRR